MGNEGMVGGPTTRRYSPQDKARAVRLVRQLRKELGTSHGTIQRVAEQIGCGVESLRTWVKQADIDEGVEPGVTSVEAKRIRELEQENRQFRARRPDALWVTDLTYVPTRSGMAYVCFIVDAFSRRIVGWRVAANMKTEMVLDALEMARGCRGSHRLIGLVTHSDHGSQGQFTSVRFTERLAEIGARPSIGTVADSYDTRRDNQRPIQD